MTGIAHLILTLATVPRQEPGQWQIIPLASLLGRQKEKKSYAYPDKLQWGHRRHFKSLSGISMYDSKVWLKFIEILKSINMLGSEEIL